MWRKPEWRLLKSVGLVWLILLMVQSVKGQDVLRHAQHLVDTLCDPVMHGRGYVNKGTQKAADLIIQEFRDYGVQALRYKGQKRYAQPFRFEVNVFPGAMSLKIDGRNLEPGKDFIVDPASGGTATERFMGALPLKPRFFADNEAFDSLKDIDLGNKALIIDKDTFKHYKDSANYQGIRNNKLDAGALIYLQSGDISWGTSTSALSYPVLKVKHSAAPDNPQMVQVNVDQKYRTFQQTQNVIGYIEGKSKPDEYLVFSAHYDHLGRMGEDTYFPGANDNASGVAMMLSLARYFSRPGNQPERSIAFMAFTGEEAGLLGSRHYTQNPFFPLDKIKFLLNLDLFGSGEKGMMAVNGRVHGRAFKRLKQMNKQYNYLPTVKARGKAANSDHYFFSQKGVPAFFCYLMADYPHYHDPQDKAGNLPYTNFRQAFRLLVKYAKSF